MLSYQSKFARPTEILDAETFDSLTHDDFVLGRIKGNRAHRAEAVRLETQAAALEASNEAEKAAELVQEASRLRQEAAKLKKALPKICWQATFEETTSKGGKLGCWRKQSAARLNGLYMLDIDNITYPRPLPCGRGGGSELTSEGKGVESSAPQQLFNSWIEGYKKDCPLDADMQTCIKMWAEHYGILLVHVTPSGQGLRIVAKANFKKEIGNLADNQRWLASQLGVDFDESCKDATRLSFCPGFEDILYMNKDELFTYDNKEYDDKYGPEYRRPTPNSKPTPDPSRAGGEKGEDKPQTSNLQSSTYHGVPYSRIISAWFDTVLHGVPGPGDRHQSLFKMACDLRYITDHDPKLLARVLLECEVGKAIATERGADEIERIAADACEKKRWLSFPKRVKDVLAAAGVQLDEHGELDGPLQEDLFDYEGYWRRLQPLLSESPVLREAVADLPDHHKLAGVLAAGAMLGTYLTRTWWEHFDGKYYRLSYLVYVVGAAASGKSFITQLDKLLMAPMIGADRIGRQAEKQWKEKSKQRKANEALPDRPHPVVRYCPSTTSNAIFYRRLEDAIDNDVKDPDSGEPLHLHIITVESELATALRSQVGSWAGKNDLELKSFHNEKAGVDYANADSTNGIMQVNWNQVISGTQESMSRKIKPQNILDGLVTRLILFQMPANDYAMIERRRAVKNHERECMLRSVGYDLEKVKGELCVPRLVDFCYEYEKKLAQRAEMEQDLCLDYFRKRIPVIMMRYALVRLILRQLKAAMKGEDLTVDDSDLEFARLIGDWCLEAQIHLFGQMVMDALENEKLHFTPRRMRDSTMIVYNQLPHTITTKEIILSSLANNEGNARQILNRWQKRGIIKNLSRGKYQKIIEKL